jgi:aminomethyltransferase
MMNASYELVRNKVALLDLQDEGRFLVSGPDAEAVLNQLLSIDLEVLPFWKGTIGLFLTEAAHIIAMATIFKSDEGFYIFTEAAAADELGRYLAHEIPARGAVFDDLRHSHALLCVLGPRAQDVMSKIVGDDLLGLPYLSFENNERLDAPLFRMGFCGEFEYRCLISRDLSASISALAIKAGAEFGITQSAADIIPILMLEMRSLTKLDIPADVNPIEAGLHWAVSFRKDGLRGGDVIHAVKHAPKWQSLMLRMERSACVTAGDSLQIEAEEVGFLSRVVYSPTLQSDIGLAYVNPEFGQVGVVFDAKGSRGESKAAGVSAPLFVTQTVLAA